MGIGDLFRRDRRAMPEPGSPEFQRAVEGSALPGSARMGQEGWASLDTPAAEATASPAAAAGMPAVESLIAAGVPAEHAQQAADAMAQLQQAFGGVEHQGSHTLDLRGMEGLRDEMREAMRQHGVDPDSGAAMDASSVPGLQEALLGVLARNGVDVSQYGPGR